MIDDLSFGALRRAATLAHALPPVRVRVRHEGRVLLDISREHGHEAARAGAGERPEADGDGTLRLPPCAFRVAVGRAHQLRSEGRAMAFLGLPGDTAPQVEVGLPCGGEAWPGGTYQVLEGRRWLYLFATTLQVSRCRMLIDSGEGGLDLAHPSVDGTTRIGLHGDEATEVTLVHTDLPLSAGEASHSQARRRMERLLATLATEELWDELGVPSDTV